MSETAFPDTEGPDTEQDSVPNTLATKVSRHEQAIREFLDPLVVQKLTGERGEIRERLREFSDHDLITFRGLVLTLKGVEDFFDDVREEPVPEGTVETLEDLRDKYGILSDEFGAVWSEERTGAKNPWPEISTTRKYNSESELPLMASEVHSGEVTLGDFRVPTSHALSMADTLLAHAGYVIRDTIRNDESIAPAEIEQLCEELESLTATASETREYIESIETEMLPSDDEGDEGKRTPIDDANYHIN